MTTQQLGQEGFRWFIGTVLDVKGDPLQLGRIKVRVYNEHDQNTTADDLQWAQVMTSTTSASAKGVGITPLGIQEGSNVVGFFIDGEEKQLPLVMGTFHTIPGMDNNNHGVSALAREENTLKKDLIGPEPESAYGAKYPNNKVYQSTAGHVIEIDDTPNHERIHVFHKSGSYIEINNEGRVVQKTMDDNFDVVKGDKTIHVQGNLKIKAEGSIAIESDRGIKLSAPGGVVVPQGSISVKESLATDTGVTGTFTSASGAIIHVQNGIVTGIK